MKFYRLLFVFIIISFTQRNQVVAANACTISSKDSIPSLLKGNFIDDYGINYTVNDTLWLQHPNAKYHVLKWNVKEQYVLAKNDDKNPSEAGLYTRIDYMLFSDMKPFLWGFCLTVYNASSESVAETAAQADRKNPKKGCNGFPFSRMKKNDKQSE